MLLYSTSEIQGHYQEFRAMHGGPRTVDANLEFVSVQIRNFTLILDCEKPTEYDRVTDQTLGYLGADPR